MPNTTGVSIANGSSEIIFAQKYGETLYILLLTSRKNTGRSSGKIKITFWIALNATFIVIKNKAPYKFCHVCWYKIFPLLLRGKIHAPSGIVSIKAPAFQNKSAAKPAVTAVVINLTYEV